MDQFMDRQEVVDRLKREAPRVCEEMEVVSVYLFGSWARAENRPASDIDIGVFLRGDALAATTWPPCDIVLEDLFADRTGLPVEVHILNTAPLSFSGRVLEEGILLYSGDEVARVRLETAVRGQYLDFKPRLKRLHDIRLRAFSERGLQ
jgi:predicted nucleotidyltransferase